MMKTSMNSLAGMAAVLIIFLGMFMACWGSATSSWLLEGVEIPSAIAVPSGNSLHVAYSAEGHQHYSFNGTSWILVNATAKLYSDANRTVYVGRHFFLATGSQPTWRSEPNPHNTSSSNLFSQVTGSAIAAVSVDPDSITWNLLQATAHSGQPEPLGSVTYIQRLQTKRGLPPSTTGANVGDTHASKYFAIYAFYIPS